MRFMNPYWYNHERISLLQRWIIIHSIIYYELDDNVVSDTMWSDNAKQLVEMMEDFPKALKKSDYFYCMGDFDASTGYNLYSSLNKHDKKYLMGIARYVLRMHGRGWKT